MLIDGYQQSGGFDEVFDYVIVGSGAAGSTAARILVETGQSVAVVEEGPALKTSEFKSQTWPAVNKMLRGAGGFVARGPALIPVLQGSCLGGSTVSNSAIMWRIPDDVFEQWDKEFALAEALPAQALHDNWDVIERELSVAPVADAVLGHNTVMKRAADAMGISAHPTRRGDTGCHGSARCLQGCPHGAKQSMLVTYVPFALRHGATIITSAKVDKLILKGNRATGVSGHFKAPPAGIFDLIPRRRPRFEIRARKAVIVAASAIQTPLLLQRSGVRNKHLGEHFQAHPGSPLLALFDDDDTNMWNGATQGYDADEWRTGRYKIETLSLPPELAFARIPGMGREWVHNMARSRHFRIWGVQLRAWAHGRVRERFGVLPDVYWNFTRRDIDNLREGLVNTARMFFAGGAREIILPIYGMPERIRSVDEVEQLRNGPEDPAAYAYILSHMFGTARMAQSPRDGVVDERFVVHGTTNLYVLDSSVFPTNLGVNPQQAIMGIAMHGAKKIALHHA